MTYLIKRRDYVGKALYLTNFGPSTLGRPHPFGAWTQERELAIEFWSHFEAVAVANLFHAFRMPKTYVVRK